MRFPQLRRCAMALAFLSVSLLLAFGADAPLRLHPPDARVPPDFFGLHIHRAFSTTPWPPVPFASWRLWGSYVRWPQVELERNQFQWDLLDKEVQLGEQHHVNLLTVLGDTPAWASAAHGWDSLRPQSPLPADIADLTDWRNYVRAVASRYKGRIQYYELWNEPNLPKVRAICTPENMLILAREAYTILKQVDPNIKVLSPSPVNPDGLRWLARYLELGGDKYADIIAYHFYVTTRPEDMLDLILPVEDIMQKHGISDNPLWNTEAGWIRRLTGRVDPLLQAPGYAARAYILNWAAGVQRFYWYAWDDDGGDSVPFTEEDETTITPSARAYAEVQKWLIGARMESCERDSTGNWVARLSRQSDSDAWILWNEDHTARFEVPKAWGVNRLTRLSGEQSAWSGTQIEINELPLMLDGKSR